MLDKSHIGDVTQQRIANQLKGITIFDNEMESNVSMLLAYKGLK